MRRDDMRVTTEERPPKEPDERDPNEPDPDFRAPSRLPTEPFNKWTGASLPASIAVWFRYPKSIRSNTLRSAFYTMMLVAIVIGAIAGAIWLVGWVRGG